MRTAIWLGTILFILLLAYAVWPLLGFFKIVSAIEARDAAALAQRVDFPALRKSITKQIVLTYLDLTGKKREQKKRPKLSMIERTFALSVGRPIAESIVTSLVNEATLLDLLTKGYRPNASGNGTSPDGTTAEGKPASNLAPFSEGLGEGIWQTWWNTEYRGNDFYAYLPPGKPRDRQFRMKLSLSGWRWQLSGLELPSAMRMQLAEELIERHKERLGANP